MDSSESYSYDLISINHGLSAMDHGLTTFNDGFRGPLEVLRKTHVVALEQAFIILGSDLDNMKLSHTSCTWFFPS